MNTHDPYIYEAPNGETFTGRAAEILNELDSAEAAMNDNFRDLLDGTMTPEDIREEVQLKLAVDYLLDHPKDLAAYIS